MIKIAVFASGSGTNAENIIKYFNNSDKATVSLVLCNKAEAYVHTRAANLGVKSISFKPSELKEGKVLDILQQADIDFVVLAGFLLKIPDDMLRVYEGKMVNIHPSLLPKYGGKGMYGDRIHETVVANKETETGITIHYTNEVYDAGVVIFQKTCQILPTDTVDDVANKVHALEYEHYPQVIDSLL